MDDVEVFQRARDLVAKKWIQGMLQDGAGGYCAIGAIHAISDTCVDDTGGDVPATGPCTILANAIGLSSIYGLSDWNDAKDRTQLQVIAAFDKAIALAEKRRE